MVVKRLVGSGSFDDVLKASKTETGRYSKVAVERIVLKFLKTAKMYKGVFQNVWLWRDSPYANAARSPISMVAQGHDRTKTAVLCHFGNLGLGKVAGFLKAAETERFDSTMVIHVDGKISARAHNMLKDASAAILSHKRLGEFGVDWNFGAPSRPKTLWKRQSEAVGVVAMGLAHAKKGKVVMPPGTGKTLVSLKVAERIVGRGKTVLVVASSFIQMLQTMREWSDNSDTAMHIVAACSKEFIDKGESITDSYIPATSDSERLASRCSHQPKDAMVAVFTTHNAVSKIVAGSGIKFDLAIYDDAHLLVDSKGESRTTLGKHEQDRCIYMTSTPQIPDPYRIRTGRNALLLDDQTCGKELYRLDFDDAVKEGMIADFRIKVVVISDKASRLFRRTPKGMAIKDRYVGIVAWQAFLHPGQKRPAIQKMLALTSSARRAAEWSKYFGPLCERTMGPIPGQIKTRHITRGGRESEDLKWWEDATDANVCRILFAHKLSNYEMPGVLFIDAFGSAIEATRYLGHVVRRQNDSKKEHGHLLIPVVLPAGESVSDPSDRTLRTAWTAFAAALAHHPGLRRELAALELEHAPKFQINTNGSVSISIGEKISVDMIATPYELKRADPARLARQIRKKFVTNSGGTGHYKAYLEKLVDAAQVLEQRMISRVANSPLLTSKIEPLIKALKSQINNSITRDQTVRVMAQHMMFVRLLGVLYDTKFVERDPVARVIQGVVADTRLAQDMWTHQDVYQDMHYELRYINTGERCRNFIRQAYNAYNSRTTSSRTKRVFDTPTEVMDFIIQSVQHILTEEFDSDLGDRSVKVLNPFSGSGGFVAQLLEILSVDSIYGKYGNEIYASDMALPAYYTTSACAEITRQMISGAQQYVPFEGTVYADTFGTVDSSDHLLKDASQRAIRQHTDNVRVIVGDPPDTLASDTRARSAGHPELEARIAKTYVASARRTGHSDSTMNSKNPYIKAQRWATDRLRGAGVIGFVVPAMYMVKDAKAGIRASMLEEFTDVWCLDICQRGVFANKDDRIRDVAIVIMVRNPKKTTHTVHYASMGKRYKGKDKMDQLKKWESIAGIKVWRKVRVNSRHWWASP